MTSGKKNGAENGTGESSRTASPRRGVKILIRLLPYYTPYRGLVLAGLGCVVVAAALGMVIPALLQRAIDGLRAGAPATLLWQTARWMVAVGLLTGVFRYGMRELLNGLSRRIETDLRDDLFRHITTLDAAWSDRTRTGEVMARLTNDVSAVRMATGPAIMYFTNTLVGGVFATILMVRIDPTLTAIALLPMVLLPIVMVRLGGRIHDRFETVQSTFGALTTMVQEHLAGVRIVRAYRQETAEVRRFEALSEEYQRLNLRLAALQGVMSPLLALLAGLGAVAVLGVGGHLVLNGTITVGQFVAFSFYLGNLTWPLIALGWVISLFQRGAASLARLLEILDVVPAVRAPLASRALPATTGGRRLEFRDVSFAYRGPDGAPGRPVLQDITFTVEPGTVLGIVGSTGSGKSTLLELIPRLRDPTQGSVLLDGIPLPELDLAALRSTIGFVPQEALLFSETIGTNLAYGTSDADAVRWATQIADLTETLTSFRDGPDTRLGERGVNLSGGQKQRATIARALARRPDIVILDDALSAVDTQTEARILEALREALAGRTAIVASHRATALRAAQWILVLDAGRIVEQGTHDALLAQRGRYWDLVQRQTIEDELEVTPVPR
jgi:ATP-binding cassette subfamily B multidrug efflux pump